MQERFSDKVCLGVRGSVPLAPLPGADLPDAVEPEAIDTLRELVGEQRFGDLLACIAQDLEGVARRLSLAAETSDAKAIRAQSHVLIGIAVTIGATGLGEAGRRLNAAARDADLARMRALLPAVVEGAGAVAERMARERARLRPA